MNKSYIQKKIEFLSHRVFLIADRLKKSEGADVTALIDAKRHFEQMLIDYKNQLSRVPE